MDKEIFDIIKKFKEIEDNIYDELDDRGMSSSDIDVILDDSMDYRDQLLRLGIHSVEEECLDIETTIQEPYEGLEGHTTLIVIYKYDNGMALCEDTSGSIHLVPQRHLACFNEEENTDDEEYDDDDDEKEAEILISKLEVDSEYVVSYLDLKIDKFKHLFFDSKEKAVAVYKEAIANKDCMSEMIQSKKEYERVELGID